MLHTVKGFCKDCTRVKVFPRIKHTSLLHLIVNYAHNFFYNGILNAYSQTFLKFALTKVSKTKRYKFGKIFFLQFSEKIFKTVLLENVL
jgi:hypothetical protein